MYLILTLAIFVNIIAILGLLIGFFYDFVQPKNKAIFGYFVVGSILLYIILLGFITISKWISNPNLSCYILTICIISPFVIGKLVEYNTLKKYTIIQIIVFGVSLITLLFK